VPPADLNKDVRGEVNLSKFAGDPAEVGEENFWNKEPYGSVKFPP